MSLSIKGSVSHLRGKGNGKVDRKMSEKPGETVVKEL